jgi:hypothetical protein
MTKMTGNQDIMRILRDSIEAFGATFDAVCSARASQLLIHHNTLTTRPIADTAAR